MSGGSLGSEETSAYMRSAVADTSIIVARLSIQTALAYEA